MIQLSGEALKEEKEFVRPQRQRGSSRGGRQQECRARDVT